MVVQEPLKDSIPDYIQTKKTHRHLPNDKILVNDALETKVDDVVIVRVLKVVSTINPCD